MQPEKGVVGYAAWHGSAHMYEDGEEKRNA
jgi:hypothetical protein